MLSAVYLAWGEDRERDTEREQLPATSPQLFLLCFHKNLPLRRSESSSDFDKGRSSRKFDVPIAPMDGLSHRIAFLEEDRDTQTRTAGSLPNAI